jgi:hypothetical protein
MFLLYLRVRMARTELMVAPEVRLAEATAEVEQITRQLQEPAAALLVRGWGAVAMVEMDS